MKDNLIGASTRVTKGNAKFTMGRNDFSEAIGKLKELFVNPSSQDIPRKSCVSNLLDDEVMELLRHDHELCCKNPRKRMGESALVCKEKWDSVNNYVIKCIKKRKENPKPCLYYCQNNESISNNHGGAFCDNTSGLGPETSPSNSNKGNAMNDGCFRYFMGDDHNMWENYGL
ncbi:unnamed protein product [Fraxinus pennsylvanica]|uniref:Uncharacterized protein n=1 Tax=Fraxinus pennsylvanica TaxID=56036 RepID=A0AAD2AC30_9LAMI|nr:unnamed protein product [Fraxinus pennsylvanica]